MTVRAIKPEELEACCALGGTGWLANVVRRIWKEGGSSPDLCFVAEHDGKPIGRVFFHRRSSSTELAMFGTHIDTSVDFFETGRALLRMALAGLKEKGVTGIEYAIYDIYDPDPALYQALIEAVGFRHYQEKKRYVWHSSGALVTVRVRLQLRPMADVGEDEFERAVGRVTVGTLDRQDRARVRKCGAAEAARWYMQILKEGEFKPSEWLLGYLADGRLCGLVVPQRLDEKEGTINYIGVVPELRGSGYGFDLLVKGTALLQQKGFKTVVAETDSENLPFHAQLEKAGYRHHGTLRCFRCDLKQGSNPGPVCG
jgi:RimJ/RimL family protein N-acetyltransferase/predicted N-acetyltransferase YhbS